MKAIVVEARNEGGVADGGGEPQEVISRRIVGDHPVTVTIHDRTVEVDPERRVIGDVTEHQLGSLPRFRALRHPYFIPLAAGRFEVMAVLEGRAMSLEVGVTTRIPCQIDSLAPSVDSLVRIQYLASGSMRLEVPGGVVSDERAQELGALRIGELVPIAAYEHPVGACLDPDADLSDFSKSGPSVRTVEPDRTVIKRLEMIRPAIPFGCNACEMAMMNA